VVATLCSDRPTTVLREVPPAFLDDESRDDPADLLRLRATSPYDPLHLFVTQIEPTSQTMRERRKPSLMLLVYLTGIAANYFVDGRVSRPSIL
jgi:hypothetical protein